MTEIGGDAAIDEFLKALDGPGVSLRRQCIEALGTLRAKRAVPKLVKLSADSQLSPTAIQALTQIPDLAALDVYLDGLASKNATLRTECRTALTGLRDAALPKIEARLATTNGLPDETIAGLRQIYQGNAAAKKSPLFKIKIMQIPIPEYQSFALADSGDSGPMAKRFFRTSTASTASAAIPSTARAGTSGRT